MCIHIHVYIYIYVYTERERDAYVSIYIYIFTYLGQALRHGPRQPRLLAGGGPRNECRRPVRLGLHAVLRAGASYSNIWVVSNNKCIDLTNS